MMAMEPASHHRIAAISIRAMPATLLASMLCACISGPAPDIPTAGISLNQVRAEGPSRWELVRWIPADGTSAHEARGEAGGPLTLNFSEGIDAAQGTVNGAGECVRFTGRYGKTENGIRFDHLVPTNPTCPTTAHDAAVLQAIEHALVTVATQPSASGGVGRQIIWKATNGALLQFVAREGIGKRGERLDREARQRHESTQPTTGGGHAPLPATNAD